MAVPRNRTSNMRKNTRRSHHATQSKNLSSCKNCGKAHLPHRACEACGHYGGRSLFEAKTEA